MDIPKGPWGISAIKFFRWSQYQISAQEYFYIDNRYRYRHFTLTMISLFFRFKLQPETIKCFPPLPVQGSGEEKKLLTKLSTLAVLHDILTWQSEESGSMTTVPRTSQAIAIMSVQASSPSICSLLPLSLSSFSTCSRHASHGWCLMMYNIQKVYTLSK